MRNKLFFLWFSILFTLIVHAAPLKIVAAENFYGELATEIGGKNVEVQSIISSPDADPHLFTTAPSISKALAKAQIIVYNGANYDSWMEQMLKSVQNQKVVVINVAELMKVKNGANPHIWYKLETFPAVAQNLAQQIIKLDRRHLEHGGEDLAPDGDAQRIKAQ